MTINIYVFFILTLLIPLTSSQDSRGGDSFVMVREADQVILPPKYQKKAHWPVIVLLHAFKVSGEFQAHYFGLYKHLKRDGFILYIPGTTRDRKGNRFWNAMDYCCNHEQLPVDDVGYLEKSIKALKQNYKVDPDRIYLLGHSNGAMMAHRLACEHADLFAGVASLAGSGMRDLSQCKPSSSVSILEIHAENDRTVLYSGMTEEALSNRLKRKPLYPYSSIEENVRYPSSLDTIENWAKLNGCDLSRVQRVDQVNYALSAFGKETSKTIWDFNCNASTEVQFWSLSRGGHVPRFNGKFQNDLIQFLLKQKKVRLH